MNPGDKMYDPKSESSNEFICNEEIEETLKQAEIESRDEKRVREIMAKAADFHGLTHREAAVLFNVESPEILEDIYKLARKVKEHIYGRRIVMFAPLYLSDYCTNRCAYCGYNPEHGFKRHKLDKNELSEEVRLLESMGHKRLALETGEDPVNCPIEYVLDSIKTIYSLKFDNGSIRRVNVNIAATTVENYKKLKDAGIGTYVLFQETYHKPTYMKVHLSGPKRNYEYHTEAHDRAMLGGIDDVGLGILFGLHDWKYEVTGLLMHSEHLEARFGVGPHTYSTCRIRKAEGVNAKDFPNLVNDADFKKIVAVLRLATPYTGMILSTREPKGYRDEVIAVGISQVSAGSRCGVGGYAHAAKLGFEDEIPQFEPEDHRSPNEMLKDLIREGYIPSYCTACYRKGRTGDRFMKFAKSGEIQNLCQPNAILTLQEYLDDYGDDELRTLGKAVIDREMALIPDPKVREKAEEYLAKIRAGERDFRF